MIVRPMEQRDVGTILRIDKSNFQDQAFTLEQLLYLSEFRFTTLVTMHWSNVLLYTMYEFFGVGIEVKRMAYNPDLVHFGPVEYTFEILKRKAVQHNKHFIYIKIPEEHTKTLIYFTTKLKFRALQLLDECVLLRYENLRRSF